MDANTKPADSVKVREVLTNVLGGANENIDVSGHSGDGAICSLPVSCQMPSSLSPDSISAAPMPTKKSETDSHNCNGSDLFGLASTDETQVSQLPSTMLPRKLSASEENDCSSPSLGIISQSEASSNTVPDKSPSQENNPVWALSREAMSSDEADERSSVSDDDGLESGEESDLEDNIDLVESGEKSDFYVRSRLREPNPQLPETVTLLQTADGSKVYLVGTAHFSLESQEDVAKTIRATQPDIVMVELCKSRVNILSLDEKTVLEESKNMDLEKVRMAIKQNGVVQGIMYLLLLSMSAHLTRQLGMAPGGEFRRAFVEARKVPGCLIHLGDRPIQITLQRAIASLSLWQKLRLAWYLLTSKEPISKEEVERCKKRDLLEEMLAEMTGEFPALSTVFVKERDIYLAYSLRLAATPIPNVSDVKGSTPVVVVGVVGIGHVPGIVDNWESVTEVDIPPILKIPQSSLTTRVIRRTLKVSLLGLAVWGCCRLLLPTSMSAALSPRRSAEWLVHLVSRHP